MAQDGPMNDGERIAESTVPWKPYRMQPRICAIPGCQRHGLDVHHNSVDALSKRFCYGCLKERKLSRGWAQAFFQYLYQERELLMAELDGLQFVGRSKNRWRLPYGVDFTFHSMKDAYFAFVDLPGARFRRIHLTESDEARILPITDLTFKDCDLSDVRFETSRLERVCFEDCILSGARFGDLRALYDCTLHRVDFFGCKLRNLVLRDVEMHSADFAGAEISRITLEGGRWRDVDLSNATIAKNEIIIERKLIVEDNCTLPAAFRDTVKRWREAGLVEGEFKYSEEEYNKIKELHKTVKDRVAPRSFSGLWGLFDQVIAATLVTICILGLASISESTARYWPILGSVAFTCSLVTIRALALRRTPA